MIKFILFTLIVFSFLNSIHNIYGQQVITENTTEIILQTNKTNSDQPKLSIIQIEKKEWWIYLLSIFIIVIVTIFSSWLFKRAQKDNLQLLKDTGSISNIDVKHKGGFWDIIREGDYYPSLARFQFLLWTFVISFTLLSVYLILLRNGILDPKLELPTNTLILMGISTIVPIISNVISKENYTKTLSSIPEKNTIPKLSTMLLEGGKPTLGRYQMFLWTFLSISIYLLQFNNYVNGPVFDRLIPDVDDSLVVLMGLSQGAYLGFKAVARERIYLVLESSTPVKDTKVDKNTVITATFNNELDATTIDQNTIILTKEGSTDLIPGESKVDPTNKKMIIFKPTSPLEEGAKYNVKLSQSLKDKDGNTLEADNAWSFETKPSDGDFPAHSERND